MVKKSVTLANGRHFNTQGEAEAHFRGTRDAYDEGVRIDDPAHHADLLALLERYDASVFDGPAKSYGGVDHFFCRLNVNPERGPKWASRGFWVMRKNVTATDFSFIEAVRGQPKSGARELYDACRNAVAFHLDRCKDRHFKKYSNADGRLPCEFSGVLVDRDGANLDHAEPFFSEIVAAFSIENGWENGLPAGVITPPADEQITTVFIDPALAQAFVAFHSKLARVRVIDKTNAPPLKQRKLLGAIHQPVDLT